MPSRPLPRLRPLALACVLGALLAPAAAHAQPAPQAADLLARAAAAHRALDAYHLAGTVDVTMTAGGTSQGMTMTVETARRGPDTLRTELRSDVLRLVAVGRGEEAVVFLPDAGAYATRLGPLRLDAPDLPVPDLAARYGDVAEGVDTAWVARAETADVGGAAREVWVVDVVYGPRVAGAPADSTRKTLWIDRERGFVLRDRTRTVTAESPFGGPATIEEHTVLTRLDVGRPPDALFAFTPPDGAEEVPLSTLLSGLAPDAGLVGQPAADFDLMTLDGETVRLSDLRGRTVLVNFWATWCGPCRMEMPVLDALHREHGDDGLVVLAVNLGDAPDAVRAYVAEYGYGFPVLLDPAGAVGDRYGATAIPVSVVVGPDGVVTHHFEGAQPEAVFRSALDDLGIR